MATQRQPSVALPIRPPYLFDPETVEERIRPLPRTAELIHAKKRVGERSVAFPRLQKTDREILRVLGRANGYKHLDELLGSLERCLASGWDAHQLGARDGDEFASLIEPAQRRTLVEQWPERNLKLVVELEDVRMSGGDEPTRSVHCGKSYGGYEPVGMLARLMKPIVAKAKKRQAGERGEEARVLICDVSQAIVAAHLDEPYRKERFVDVLKRELEPQVERNYDVIALCERRGWHTPLRLDFAVSAEAYGSVVGELFGSVATIG